MRRNRQFRLDRTARVIDSAIDGLHRRCDDEKAFRARYMRLDFTHPEAARRAGLGCGFYQEAHAWRDQGFAPVPTFRLFA